MSDWSEIKKKINSTTKKIAKKTTEVADTASKHIKLKSLDGKLSDHIVRGPPSFTLG